MKTSRVLFIFGGIALLGTAVYLATKKTAASATGSANINSLPGRAYATNTGSNMQAQPPTPVFAPFSGVPFVESALSLFSQSGSTPTNVAANPNSNDSNNGTLTDAVASGFSTTDLFGNTNYGATDFSALGG